MSSDVVPFGFVVGCGRSGTTLLRAMLDSHPELAIPPESYFVIPVLRRADTYGTGAAFDLDALLDDVTGFASFDEWQLDPQVLRTSVGAAEPEDAASALRAVYRAYASMHGKSRIGDKTPYHVLHMDLLARAFPEARFVHLIRDGRDVARSLAGMPFGPNHFPAATLYWKTHVECGRTAGRRLGPGRYLELRFEEMVEDPDAAISSVCELLALEPTPAMLRYHERADELLHGLRRSAHLQGIHERPTLPTEDWSSQLPEGDATLFELLAGDLRDQLEYPPGGGSASVADRGRATGARIAYRLGARTRRARVAIIRRVRASTRGKGPSRREDG